ncbi:glycosyl hydrolase [Paenibacillus methanolicus]|uniref:Mannan endo-1,4-beta-mannosidase n=1 Tax=Paenibacillus methanolicus TaxID=582686 RepID=A0A5S5BYN1_9BACL|nr:glycosyl hydrolase [Paenibacillus methanolicus]TYP71312.1 mannan endo-1,4-beta-mannosidase [Paenibacillus methanolicus]
MRMRKWLPYVLVFLLGASVIASADAHTVGTVNVNASQKTKDTLNWLAHLPNRTANKTVSGFFGGYSGHTFSTQQLEELRTATGQHPGIFGCDYGAGWASASDPTTLINYDCNSGLKSYAAAGGLATVNVHYPSPGVATGGNLNTKLANFGDLLNPSTDTGARWRAYLDKTAVGLQDLENAGVTVLWRPFHEMNGDWFWWGNQDAAAFKNAWIQMYNYFTVTKGLDNLIWIYAPDFSRGNRTAYYPGANYVDIVGLDAYDDNPASSVTGYDELVALGKPFAFTEIGPDSQGTFDYAKWINAIKTNFPKTVYFFAWNDGWAPHRNQNASALLNDAWTVNRGEIALSSITEAGGSGGGGGSATTLYDFEGSTQSWAGGNVTGGPWTVSEWKAGGASGLKADINLGAATKSYTLYRAAAHNLSGKSLLKARVATASWGSFGSGMTAKLYIKTGSGYQWYDSGAVSVTSAGTTLSLSLAGKANLGDVREIGVEFGGAANGSGTSSIYADSVTVE